MAWLLTWVRKAACPVAEMNWLPPALLRWWAEERDLPVRESWWAWLREDAFWGTKIYG